jgi:DNA-binding CsgD family transcriptional regulator
LPTREPIDRALTGVISCVGQSDFGTAALSSLNVALALDSWSIYRVYRQQPPRLHASGSYRVPDTTAECFRVYQRGLFRADSSFDDARACAASAGPLMTHLRAEELAAPHRDKIYFQHGMRERISLILPDASGDGLVAVNLYRHLHQRPFEREDFHVVQTAAPLLLACVGRHLQLAGSRADLTEGSSSAAPVSGGLERIKRRCPSLTARELQICDRLLRGWTHDGIAADLRLSVPTVKTYRNRAFDRLGIHFRNELFSLALEADPAH